MTNPEHIVPFGEENIQVPETISITPDLLYESNHSELAKEKRELWEESRSNGELTVVEGCGDARLVLPETTIHVRTIASAGPKEPFSRLPKHKGVKNIVVLTHHDGDTVVPEEVPAGCGGLLAKSQAINLLQKRLEGIGHYVDQHIHHPDILRQAYESAFQYSAYTDKPVLAATQDHLDGAIYPFAAFWDQGRKAVAAVSLRNMREDYYNPRKIYENGIPLLDKNEIPESFLPFLEMTESHATSLHEKYRDFRKMQKVQNPKVVALSTGIRPLAVTYPEIFSDPNTVFQLSVARDRVDDATIYISDEVLETTFNQAEYPLTHAVEHFGSDDKPFSKTDTVLIETPYFDQSERLATKLSEKAWMKNWLSLPNHQIIVAQKKAGIVSQIEIFTE